MIEQSLGDFYFYFIFCSLVFPQKTHVTLPPPHYGIVIANGANRYNRNGARKIVLREPKKIK